MVQHGPSRTLRLYDTMSLGSPFGQYIMSVCPRDRRILKSTTDESGKRVDRNILYYSYFTVSSKLFQKKSIFKNGEWGMGDSDDNDRKLIKTQPG